MNIERIDGYTDGRFSRTVLNQHGGYLVSGEPYEIEITGPGTAVIRGRERKNYAPLIKEFRFHAPHIFRFYSDEGAVAEYPEPSVMEIGLNAIQPSQFFVDEEKLEAVGTFISRPEDIVIQVLPWGNRYIALDGHTRLYLAVMKGFGSVRAVESGSDGWIWRFVREAQLRNITRPCDMKLLPHEQYEIMWNRYCDTVFEDGGQTEKPI